MSQRISGIALLISSIFLYGVSLDIQVPSRIRGPEPGVWPRILLVLLAILSVMLIADSFRRARPTEEKCDDAGPHTDDRRTLATILLCGAYSVGLESIGFVIATAVLIPALMFLFGTRRFLLYLIVPIPFTILVALLFGQLGIVMPLGEGMFRSIGVLVLQR